MGILAMEVSMFRAALVVCIFVLMDTVPAVLAFAGGANP
jgi:hypothetical protein